MTTEVTPTFDPIGPICQNAAAPALPGTSIEGITGTWTPAAISTAIAGTFTYTFTPNDPTQCGVPEDISVTVTTEVTPTFDAIGPICQNAAAPALPGTSIEGITGTWTPAAISTAIAGTFTYTFTPNDPTQCGVPADISVT